MKQKIFAYVRCHFERSRKISFLDPSTSLRATEGRGLRFAHGDKGEGVMELFHNLKKRTRKYAFLIPF